VALLSQPDSVHFSDRNSAKYFNFKIYVRLYFCMKVHGGMALKQVFQDMESKIAENVDPDSLTDVLLSKEVISRDDYSRLRQVLAASDRCQDLLSVPRVSSDPQTFIHLRLSLLDEYSWILDEIDDLLTSPTWQQQHLQFSHPTDGNRVIKYCLVYLF